MIKNSYNVIMKTKEINKEAIQVMKTIFKTVLISRDKEIWKWALEVVDKHLWKLYHQKCVDIVNFNWKNEFIWKSVKYQMYKSYREKFIKKPLWI